jgi:uncharacterized protein YdaU (DUF1376 family)
MTALPYLPLSIEAWTTDTGHLTHCQRGIYLDLLILMWRTPGCRVPNDDKWLIQRLKLQPTEYRPLISEFCQTDGNWITQKRLSKEYKFVIKTHDARSVAAKRKWQKKKDLYRADALTLTLTRSVSVKESDSISASQGSAEKNLNGHCPNDFLSDDGKHVLIPAFEIEALQAECPNYSVRRNIGGLYRSDFAKHLPFEQRKSVIFQIIRKRSAEKAEKGIGRGPKLSRRPGWLVPIKPSEGGTVVWDKYGNRLGNLYDKEWKWGVYDAACER